MSWKLGIRQLHRWLSIIFTLSVIANFAAMSLGKPPAWLVYAPLLPLFLLLFTGLYMFALPYRRRSAPVEERDPNEIPTNAFGL